MTSRDLHRRPGGDHAAGHGTDDVPFAAWEEERYRRFFLTSPLGLMRESAGGEILEAGPALLDLLGYQDPAGLEGRPSSVVFADPERATSSRATLLREGELEARDTQLARADGGTLWVEHHAVLVPVPGSGRTEIFRTFVDIDHRRERERELQEMAYHDGLTGVPNRRLLEIRAVQTLALADRRESHAALVFLDLMEFKIVNDRLGHGSGDSLLRNVARRIEGELRSADTVARMGGDEFAVLLSEVEDREAAVRTATRLLGHIATPVPLEGRSVVIEARAGLALYPEDGGDLPSLLRHADRALIRAKVGREPVVSEVG